MWFETKHLCGSVYKVCCVEFKEQPNAWAFPQRTHTRNRAWPVLEGPAPGAPPSHAWARFLNSSAVSRMRSKGCLHSSHSSLTFFPTVTTVTSLVCVSFRHFTFKSLYEKSSIPLKFKSTKKYIRGEAVSWERLSAQRRLGSCILQKGAFTVRWVQPPPPPSWHMAGPGCLGWGSVWVTDALSPRRSHPLLPVQASITPVRTHRHGLSWSR